MLAAGKQLNILGFFLPLLRCSIFALRLRQFILRQFIALWRCADFLRRPISGNYLGGVVGPIVNRGVRGDRLWLAVDTAIRHGIGSPVGARRRRRVRHRS